MTSDGDVDEWVMQQVRERTEPVVDGEQTHAAVFTGARRLRQDAAQRGCPHSKDAVDEAVDRLVEQDRLYNWHGQITLAEREYLKTVVKNESQAGFTRRILVGQVNDLLQQKQSDAEEVAHADD